jgi:hypothetical protein
MSVSRDALDGLSHAPSQALTVNFAAAAPLDEA